MEGLLILKIKVNSMKCTLVNLRGGSRKTGTKGCANIFEPIGILSIASFIEENYRISVEVIHQLEESEIEIFNNIISTNPSVVGFSVLTVTVNPSLRIAEKLKLWNPKINIVFGGDHPTALPNIAKNFQVDYVIRGEGEIPFLKLLNYINGEIDIHSVPSLTYYKNKLVHNPSNNEFNPVFPPPKRYSKYLQNCRVGGLMNPFMTKQKSVAVIAATRGCPFNCSFCTSKLMWGQKYEKRNPELVVDEIEKLQYEYGTNTIFFTDLTLSASKKYTIELCNELIKRDSDIHWYSMCNLHSMDKELCDAMSKAKCSKLGFGIESFIPETMKGGKGNISVSFEQANEKLKIVNNSGIFSKAYLIIGFPWESKADYDLLINEMNLLEAHELRVSFFVPFPGTELFNKNKDSIIDHDFDNWSCLDKPVVKGKDYEEHYLFEVQQKLYDNFYSSNWIKRINNTLYQFPKLKDAISDYLEYEKNRGSFNLCINNNLKDEFKLIN